MRVVWDYKVNIEQFKNLKKPERSEGYLKSFQ